ncbi:nitrate reductase [Phytohalomonas tamaricis]|uniref:nitrate reductase n=1 Tax=Phytohalomonas tamaricis TaxID=2081032 RepID=UPI000D0AC0EA|nr:nitrate reductase [Phytohalomonas tamaricis]
MRATTTCPYCGVGCGVIADIEKRDGCEVMVGVQGDREHPANYGKLCVKGSALHETLGSNDRVLMPRVDGHEVSWDEALDSVATRLGRVMSQQGGGAIAGYLSGQLLTEDYYIANKLFKGFLGTPHVDTNSRLCMASAVAGYKRAFGADAVPCCYEDIEEAELLVLVGSNLAWNHPVLYQRVRTAKRRNPLMRVVVIDPRVTDTCEIADLYLGITPGSDTRLFNGLLTYMAQRGHLDKPYLEAHTQGFQEALAAASADSESLEDIAAYCDIDMEALETFYYWFATQLHVVTLYSQGVNQSTSGTDKSNAIINCHLAGGKIGIPGGGPFSITGQPNAMGGREVGGLANQLAAHMDYHTPGAIDRVTRFWATDTLIPTLPTQPGHKAVDLFDAIERGEIQALWVMATNPAVSMPDANRVRRALAKCPLVIVSECMTGTDMMKYADIVLPATSWSEKDGTVTNSERRISRQRGLMTPPGEAKNDWWTLCEVAKRLGFADAFTYQHPHEIFDEHARLSGFENTQEHGRRLFDISGLVGLGREGYDAIKPIQWPVTAQAPGGTARLFEDGRFITPNGLARLVPVRAQAPQQQLTDATPLRLNTGRIRDQWHTMSRTSRAPRLMNHRAEPYIDVHPDDAHKVGVVEGGLGRLNNAQGEYVARIRLATAQRRGEVFVPMHWNDQFTGRARMGALIEAVVDPVSGQPESKHGAVQLAPFAARWEACLMLAEETNERSAARVKAAVDYWARIPMANCQRLQMAGSETLDWSVFCRDVLGSAPTLWCEDTRQGTFRAAALENGRLKWWLAVAPPAGLPALNWLDERFGEEAIDADARRRLLAGSEAGGEDTGPVVCSCHQVGQKTITKAIQEGANSVESLGERLCCGTQCGSCIPELKTLIQTTQVSEERSHDRVHEATQMA